ncbi:hypothetical protein A2U01_0090641, partial [Trifolium medium]|nr:hypothetical protein [Trifolium medium]
MPTFTAIAFDRLIEPGGSRAGHQKSASISVPPPKKLERRTSEPPSSRKRVPPCPQLKPSLYATPE